ncbi:MAG TPA: S9 family peptidase [Thermoanaerobaculia bacterium]|nr:S9 family peptidase [Thermoanaerobaculia bacterium]
MHNRFLTAARALALAALTIGPAAATFAQLPPLIPRETLFGNPERVSPRLSPDGKHLAWIAPDKKNVLQVWVKTIGKDDDKVITADKKRGIRQYFWTEDNNHIVYAQDNDGDENFHLYGVDLDSGTVRDYTPFLGTRATPVASEPSHPDEMLVSINARDRRVFDVYRLNLSTGALVLDTKNPGDILGWIADKDLHVRGGQAVTPDGGTDIRLYDNGEWKSWLKAAAEDNVGVLDFTPDGKALLLESSLGRDTAAVVARNLADNSEKVVASSPEVDVESVSFNPVTHVLEAVEFAPGRASWTIIDPSVKADYDAIGKLYDGDFAVVNRDRADKTWLVAFTADKAPTRYYTYDRTTKAGMFLFSARPKLDNLQLASMKPVVIPSRDGLKLNSYLTLPVGVAPKNLPMVLFVHGGPWGRDTWGYAGFPQWLANRGYAVLQVNFRASTGYGKKFLHAGDKQWGLTMQDDLTDAVNWAIKQGYADPKKVAIMGGSYGGYATLAGLAFTPDLYACGVDIVGPSNLKTLIGSIPPYWKPMRAMFDARMGNVDDPKEAELVKNASPLFKANAIKKPLLIGQGANDPRVNHAESEQIVDAIEKNNGSVTYVVYSDEGHGFARPENNIDFNARAEAFLGQCLGGRIEPLSGEKWPGSTATVKVVSAK